MSSANAVTVLYFLGYFDWADGGPTDLDNLVLLCRFHHRLIHHSGWEVVMGHDRHPWFIPPEHRDRFREPLPADNRGSPARV